MSPLGRAACAVLAAGVLFGCAEPVPPDEPLSTLPAQAGPLDALNRRHARLRERMRRRGYGTEVGLARQLVVEDRGIALPLDLAVDECSTFLALGGGSIRNLVLTLYDDAGVEIADDSVNGEGGLVHACPLGGRASHRPFYLVLRAREGAGAVIVAQFRSAPGEGEGFDGLFEGVLAPPVPFRQVEEHLARSRGALRARGFIPIGEPMLERVTEGAVVRLPVELEAGRCYVAIGRTHGVRDIDLFLFDAAGVEVERDLAADAEPSLEHCPPESGRYTVELRAFEGAGAVGALVLVGPGMPAQAPSVDAAAEDRPSEPSLLLEILATPLREQGFAAPLFVARDAQIVPGEVRTHEVVIGPGCSVVVGAASHEGMDLDLYLADDTGREIDRDTAVHSTARVRACRPTAALMRVAVKSYGRDGTYGVAVMRAPERVDSLRSLRLEEAAAAFRPRGYVEAQSVEALLAQGERLVRPIQIEAGQCVAVVAAGNETVEDLDLFLRGPDQVLLTSDSGPAPHAAVSRCAEVAETLDVEALVFRGEGEVAVRVLAQTPPDDRPRPEASARPEPPGGPRVPRPRE